MNKGYQDAQQYVQTMIPRKRLKEKFANKCQKESVANDGRIIEIILVISSSCGVSIPLCTEGPQKGMIISSATFWH